MGQQAMASGKVGRKPLAKRSNLGSILAEFSAAFLAFVVFIFIPLLDLCVIPIRYAVAYGAVNQLTHRMALCETVSKAVQMPATDTWWSGNLQNCGIHVTSSSLVIKVVSKLNMQTQVMLPVTAPVPTEWQPDSPNGPFYYYLELTSNLQIAPLLQMSSSGAGIPGLTGPAPVSIVTDAEWENLGRDPDSANGDYYMNE